jgi:hypothetical protein
VRGLQTLLTAEPALRDFINSESSVISGFDNYPFNQPRGIKIEARSVHAGEYQPYRMYFDGELKVRVYVPEKNGSYTYKITQRATAHHFEVMRLCASHVLEVVRGYRNDPRFLAFAGQGSDSGTGIIQSAG